MDIYREHILDHYRHPRGQGIQAGVGWQETGRNPLCGDEVTVQVLLQGNLVATLNHAGHGCAISRAAASLLSEAAAGVAVAEVLAWDRATVESWLGTALPASRLQCGLLALLTAQQIIQKNYAVT